MAITTIRLIVILCVVAVSCLADTVTLQNQNFSSVLVEAKTGPDQQHVENAKPLGTQTLSKGGSWRITCTRGEFVIYRSHEPANDWSDWTAAFCSGDTSVRISDGGRVH
jgi:hypothetical protein